MRSTVFTLLVLALEGCAAMIPEGEAVSAETLCDEVTNVLCSAEEQCCMAAAGSTAAMNCRETQKTACRETLGRAAVDPRLGYKPTRAGALIAALRTASAACGTEALPYASFVHSFVGTGSEGSDCTPPDTTTASLRASSLSCAEGLACRLRLRSDNAVQGTCEKRTDSACSHALDCDADRWCNLPANWRPSMWGTCQPLRQNGWMCGGDSECASRYCSAAGTCAARGERALCTAQAYSSIVLADGPVAYYRLGDVARTSARDSSTSALNGTYEGTTARVGDGAIVGSDDDGALALDGSGGRAVLPRPAALATARALSMECWIRLENTAGNKPILEFSSTMNRGLHLWNFDEGTKLYVNFIDAAGMDHSIMTDMGTLEATRWYHVVTTFDGSVGRLYLNGARVGQTAVPSVRTEGELRVGYRAAREMEMMQAFNGAVDEVALYDRALSESAVRRHYEAGTAGPLRQASPLFGWLR